MKKILKTIFVGLIMWCEPNFATHLDTPVHHQLSIVGGGIIGALESYYAYQDAQKNGQKIRIVVYEKGEGFDSSGKKFNLTNTSYHIVPSLTPDEILSVVPRGKELVEKLNLLFSEPGGIRVDDVSGINDSESAQEFKNAVVIDGIALDHEDRTQSLLKLGKLSMDLWQQMYDEGDQEFKLILEASNFNPCHEPIGLTKKVLHDGYRIDLIYDVQNAQERALTMLTDYEKLGYKQCVLLLPEEVVVIDPSLTDFCDQHSTLDSHLNRIWNKDTVALWRPGGCIDTRIFLPRLYDYLKKKMGQYYDSNDQVQDCFQIQFNSEVASVQLNSDIEKLKIIGLTLSNGKEIKEELKIDHQYVFCPGESVGFLRRLGFCEPSYAAFAGPSLLIQIPLPEDQIENYRHFSHCMEVHQEGIVLAWQAKFQENKILIGVAGTKAFYGDKRPRHDEAFAKNRNLVQFNIINTVLPELISLATGYNTKGKALNADDLASLEEKGMIRRWVGRRAVAYDGFPTLGYLYYRQHKVLNARCTTHLGSGGVSFGPATVLMSRRAMQSHMIDPLTYKILKYADSRRKAILEKE